jgi:dienelactone hydrolase
MKRFSTNVNGFYDVADQMADLLRRQAERALASQLEQKTSLSSVAAFEARRARVREHFLAAIGGLPKQRTPLNPQCTGRIERPGYTVEKLIYESLPDFLVTTLLYVPNGITKPAAAVIFVHGHWDHGKAAEEYQAVCIDLARNGFVVLAIDPPGQGERKQYYEPATGELRIAHCTDEHTYSGLQFVVGGASLARHFIWDAMRGIDYLESRVEVDPARIGITGNSGGGTQTSLLMMAEPRLAAAAPCTFIMTLASYMKSGQPQDSEQIIRGCFVDGPDHDDYLTMLAPKPVLVGVAAYDFFPIEGALEAVERAKRVYRLYGAADKLEVAIAPTGHTYGPQLREAAVNWFRVHLQGAPADFRTGSMETLPTDMLWCTPKGQVLDYRPQSRTVIDLNRERLTQQLPPRQSLTNVRELDAHVVRMRQLIPQVLGVELNKRTAPIYPRIIWQGEVDGYRCEQLFFFSETDVVVTGVLIHPNQDATQTDLVLLENGTNDIPQEHTRLHKLLAASHRLFVFDVRGVGAVQMRPVNHHLPPHDTEYKLGCDAMMLKQSTLGMRVLDVLRAYDYLRSRGDVERIGLVGVDSGAFFAYFAAALEPGFAALTFEKLLYSYHHLAVTKYYDQRRFNLKVMAWGILAHFDLVDLLPALAPRPCTFVHLLDASGAQTDGNALMVTAHTQGYLPTGWSPQFA